MEAPHLWFGGIVIVLILSWSTWSPKLRRALGWRKASHRRRERSAAAVLDKLASIEHFAQKLAYLRKVDPFTFEELILSAFERRGCKVKRNQRYSGDGGIDGRFWIGDQLYLVQAKRYSGHVSRKHVTEFCRLVERRGCRGVFVHTGRTSKAVLDMVGMDERVSIVSGGRLIKLLTQHGDGSSRA